MAKFKSKVSGSIDTSESGNWNTAKKYSDLKIMKWLYLIDEYETIAMFGTSELIEDIITSEEIKNIARIKALERLFHATEKVLRNTRFALFKEGRASVEVYKKDLNLLRVILPNIKEEIRDDRSKRRKVIIKEEVFNFLLNQLMRINEEMLEPLNKASLIFMAVEEFDPDDLKKKLMEDIIHG